MGRRMNTWMDGKNGEVGQTDTQAHGFTDTQGRNNCLGLRLLEIW